MCGIAGFIDASLSHDEKSIVLENMLEKIAHRGPDARGKWYHESVALGQNRLSIIDLSEDDIKEELESETFGFKEFMSSVRKGLEKKKLKEHTEKENAIVEAFKKELGGL